MTYKDIANVYDEIIGQDYDKWADYLMLLIRKYCPFAASAADIACGTGSIIARLEKQGLKMCGADLSAEMLAVAKQKTSAPLYRQNITSLALSKRFDVILCTLDSINYIMQDGALQKVFEHVRTHLNQGGAFIFDIATKRSFDKKVKNKFIVDNNSIVYTLQSTYAKKGTICRQYVTCFYQSQTDDTYQRFDEVHRQRVYSAAEVHTLLQSSGFTVAAVHQPFEDSPIPHPQSEFNDNQYDRLFFVAT